MADYVIDRLLQGWSMTVLMIVCSAVMTVINQAGRKEAVILIQNIPIMSGAFRLQCNAISTCTYNVEITFVKFSDILFCKHGVILF